MTTTNLEMTLDDIAVDSEVSGERSHGPSLRVEDGEKSMIFLSQLGLTAPAHVYRRRDGFDVCMVDAKTNAAKMVGLKTLGPRANSLHPHGAMGHRLAPFHAHLPVSPLAYRGTLPHPARASKTTVFNAEVTFIEKSYPASSHIDASYPLRAAYEGYED